MAAKSTLFSLEQLQEQLSTALRRTVTNPNINGYRPQFYQLPFHLSRKKIRLFLGGNRVGKTVGGGAESVKLLIGTAEQSDKFPPPVRGRGVGIDFDGGIKKIMLPEIARWMPPSYLKNGSWEDSYSKGDKRLDLTNGSFMEFLSNDQDVSKHAGTSRHYIWIDEECDEAIYNENMARLVDTEGLMFMTLTPLLELSWSYDRLYVPGKAGTDPNIDVFEASTEDNIYVSSAELSILTDGLKEAEKEARLYGKYMSQHGTIYKKVLTESNFVPSILEDSATASWSTIYRKWGFMGCLDQGLVNPTAFYLIAYDGEGRMIVFDEYYEAGNVVEVNAKNILKRIRELKLQDKIEYIVADPTIRNRDPITGTSVQAEYGEHGLYLSLGNNDVHAGIDRMSNRLQKNLLLITENCVHLKWELPRYRWDKYQSRKINDRRNAKEEPLKKDDHGCDAVRYAVMSRPMLPGEATARMGNIIGGAIAINKDDNRDWELYEKMHSVQAGTQNYDPTLGTEY